MEKKIEQLEQTVATLERQILKLNQDLNELREEWSLPVSMINDSLKELDIRLSRLEAASLRMPFHKIP